MCSDRPEIHRAIAVENLGKCYHIYARPQDRLKQAFLRWRGAQHYREFWALRHVSFDVRRGETVGIIGRNGSGKSTLLQMIAGTLTPSEGRVTVNGRVAALLELGSGFNTEFTGRENIYMNGAILGLSREEIAARFDEIVAFADIGDFLDQPVKTYSSGMVVRLAFAVQVQVEPDILIVDEALAVGDEAFQRKCYARLERFRAAGGITLFVTHGTQSVVQLCDRAVLLDRGELVALGPSKPVVDLYQKFLYGTAEEARELRQTLLQLGRRAEQVVFSSGHPKAAGEAQRTGLPRSRASYDEQMFRPPEVSYGTGEAEILDVAMLDENGQEVNVLVSGQGCTWRYRVRFGVDAEGVRFGMMIKTPQGVDVAGISNVHLEPGQRIPSVKAGQVMEVRFHVSLNLAPGTYFLNSGVSRLRNGEEDFMHRRVDVAAIRVISPDRRDVYGLAFLDPRMSWSSVEEEALSHA